jgi:amino acid permease
MRDVKHRLNNTVIFILTLIISIESFFLLLISLSYEISALISFAIAVLIYTLYAQWSLKEATHEITKINTHTQIWLGQIVLVACVLVLIGNTIIGIDFSTMLMWMSGTVIAVILLTIRRFDIYLEHKVKLEDSKKIDTVSKTKNQKKRGKKK